MYYLEQSKKKYVPFMNLYITQREKKYDIIEREKNN